MDLHIRGPLRNLRYPTGPALTSRDILGDLPFNNVFVVLAAIGAQVCALIEHGLTGVGEGRFLHVSGLRVAYDPQRSAGPRIVAVTVGGDRYSMFKESKRLVGADSGFVMANAVIDDIRAQTSIAPKVEGKLSPR